MQLSPKRRRRRGGRPRLPKEDVKTHMIAVRVTKAMHSKFVACGEATGGTHLKPNSFVEYLRHAVESAIDKYMADNNIKGGH